jgi:hypothetical protein
VSGFLLTREVLYDMSLNTFYLLCGFFEGKEVGGVIDMIRVLEKNNIWQDISQNAIKSFTRTPFISV